MGVSHFDKQGTVGVGKESSFYGNRADLIILAFIFSHGGYPVYSKVLRNEALLFSLRNNIVIKEEFAIRISVFYNFTLSTWYVYLSWCFFAARLREMAKKQKIEILIEKDFNYIYWITTF
jgi:hypothetical protein